MAQPKEKKRQNCLLLPLILVSIAAGIFAILMIIFAILFFTGSGGDSRNAASGNGEDCRVIMTGSGNHIKTCVDEDGTIRAVGY